MSPGTGAARPEGVEPLSPVVTDIAVSEGVSCDQEWTEVVIARSGKQNRWKDAAGNPIPTTEQVVIALPKITGSGRRIGSIIRACLKLGDFQISP